MPRPSSDTTVYLLRSASEPDPYVQALDDRGLTATCIPVLRFDFSNQDELLRRIRQAHRYGGLILTSSRAVRALADVLAEREHLRAAWRAKPAYAVGPKTGAALRELGFAPKGEGSGRARALISVIEKQKKPLLFLAGNRRRDTIPEELRARGIPFEEITVYHTKTRDDVKIPGGRSADWLAFFSPSGIEAICQSPGVQPETFRMAAIGPTTASALRAEGWQVEAIAEQPAPEALARAINAAEVKTAE